jgi:hypothetical protein
MNTFERDFTQELEKCVRNGTADLPIVTSWNPGRVAPPEIHVSRGLAVQAPIESIHYQLRRSETFIRIGNVLGLTLSESLLTTISKQPIDTEKAQVWMFARWWFNSYAEYLLDSLTQRSSFYKERHDEFLTLMRHMLEFQAPRRLTFKAALAAWFPESDLFTKEAQSEDDDESETEDAPPPAAAVAVATAPSPPAVAAAAPTPQAVRRLVLKGWGGSAARNRTRKNQCN